MPFKSIIQDTKDEIGNISRKGFEVKLRSHRAVLADDGSAAAVDAVEQSCWSSMPPELLREVLMWVEDSEGKWPLRKQMVACAGVCRSWRDITMEIVKTPELSGKLTFPISVKQPGPRDFLLQCFIKRNGATQTYYLYLGLTEDLTDTGKFLLAARKRAHATYSDHIISLDAVNMTKGGNCYMGKLRSNFLGTKFTIYDGVPPQAGAMVPKSRYSQVVGSKQISSRMPSGNYPVAHIAYEPNSLGSRGPRRIQCVMDSIPASAMEPGGMVPTQTEFPLNTVDSFLSIPFLRSKSSCMENFLSGPLSGQKEDMLVLKSKVPWWNEHLKCWCLNFQRRVKVASVKNFQLVASAENGQEHEKVLLQFGKVKKDLFTMDYGYPLSAFQAFAICLSSFATEIACE